MKTYLIIISAILNFIYLNNAVSQITITYPSASDTIYIGENINIRWTGANNFPVTLEYSTNNGTNWILIADYLSDDNYNWSIPYSDSCRIKFRATASLLKKPFLLWEIPKAHVYEIRSVQISPDGKYILSTGKDLTVRLWDIAQRKIIDSVSISGYSECYSANFLHNNDSIIIAVKQKGLLWNRKNKTLTDITGGLIQDQIRACPVHPFKSIAGTSSYRGELRIFDLTNNTQLQYFQEPDSSELYSASFSKDGNHIVYSTSNGRVYVRKWDDASHPLVFLGHGVNGSLLTVWSSKMSDDNKFAVSGGVDKTVRLWNIEKQSQEFVFNGHTAFVRGVDYYPNGKFILSGSMDSTLRQWNLTTMQEFSEVRLNHGDKIICTAYSFTGDSIVSGGRDSTIRLWRNFEFTASYDTVTTILKYKIIVKIPHIVSYVGDNIKIPLICEQPYKANEIQSRFFDASVKIEIPNKLLAITDNINITNSITRKDTISFLLNNFLLEDTLASIGAIVLQGDVNKEEIRLVQFDILNDSLLKPMKQDGSITVLPNCSGQTVRQIGFSSTPLNITINPNPANEQINFELDLIEDGKYKIEIYDQSGRLISKLFEAEFKHGQYIISTKTENLQSGIYSLRLISPTKILNKQIVLIH